MSARNYAAWAVDTVEISDNLTDEQKFVAFLRYAILSPSGHNSQPWKIEYINGKNTSIRVSINPDHHLSSDGSGLLTVEPHISIGCFLETLDYAAKGFGYLLETNYSDLLETHIADITILKKTTPQPELLAAIKNRASNRNKYQQQSIDRKVLETIGKSDHTDVAVTIIDSNKEVAFIADKTEEAIKKILDGPRYRAELGEWVRNNFTKKYDGMPGKTHGIPALPSLLSKLAMKYVPAKSQADKFKELLENSSGLFIVSAKENTKSSINAGRQYTKICLQAQLNGFSTSALGASVVHPSTNEDIREKYQISYKPLYILRIGIATKMGVKSPRYPLEKVAT